MDNKQKILVSGDVGGKFKVLFSRVQAINEKNGPFDFLFCVGDFFGDSLSSWAPYKNGAIKVPIPTYILGPNREEHSAMYDDINGCEMCPNVSYLGKRGLLSSSGLSIAYLSGTQGQSSSTTQFSKKDVTDLKEIVMRSKFAGPFLGVDILLSSAWPKNVTNHHADCSIKKPLNYDSEELAWLSTHIRPRYHFAGLENIYYERPPYSNYHVDNETSVHCSRFLALPKVGNEQKQKWLYAASLTPIDQMKAMDLYQVTVDETPCPFPSLLSESKTAVAKQFFYDMDTADDHGKKRKEDKRERYDGKRQAIDQNTCWFCLGSPAVEKHLVVSIGEQVYLALAKGGLTEYHAMILPIQHHRSLAHVSNDIESEIKKFKSALKRFCKKLKMVPVYFERNYKTSHFQLNFIPVPKSVAGKLKASFMSSAQELEMDLEELPEHCKLNDAAQVDKPYFYIELPDSDRLFCSCKKNFPLEFARDVLAGVELLDLPHRVSWRDCITSKTEETRLAEVFRDDFKEFDFTNDDDDLT